MILTYSHTDKNKVIQKNELLLNHRHSIGNKCLEYSPYYFDETTNEHFIIIKKEHLNVYGLKSYSPIDKTEFFKNKDI
jgi:hypothetical protein